MVKKLVVGLQVICLCVVVSFFAVEVVSSVTDVMVGGSPCDHTTQGVGARCTTDTTAQCPNAGANVCPSSETFRRCTYSARGLGLCVETKPPTQCTGNALCAQTRACRCELPE